MIVRFYLENKTLVLEFIGEGLSHRKVFDGDYEVLQNEVLSWLLAQARPVFFEHLPVPNVEVQVTQELAEVEALENAVSRFSAVLETTNALLLELKALKGSCLSHSHCLFYNVDQQVWFKSIHDECAALAPERVFYDSMCSGWDAVARNFSSPTLWSPRELTEKISSLRIKTLISLNSHFLMDTLRTSQVYLPALLHFLGVEHIVIDFDIYMGLSNSRTFFNDLSCRRYSEFPHWMKFWDKAFEDRNIEYIVTPCRFPDPTEPPFNRLESDYEVVTASHSRVVNVLRVFEPVVFVLDRLSKETPFYDLQCWYYAFRHLLLEESQGHLYLKRVFEEKLYHLFLGGLTFLKYNTLENLNAERPLLLYGDKHWNDLFPQHYQGRYLKNDELREKFSKRRSLYLLPNEHYSYLECNFVIQQSFETRTPYLTFPAFVVTDALKGLRTLEYDSAETLNSGVSNINALCENESLHTSVRVFKELVDRFTRGFTHRLVWNQPIEDEKEDNLVSFFSEHEEQSQVILKKYLQQNRSFLMECFQKFFRPTESLSQTFDVRKSCWFEKEFVQRLFYLHQKG